MKKELVLVEISDEKPMREWAAELRGPFHEEALESINRENVLEEHVFYLELEGKKYLAFYMVGEMLPADMSMEVNQKHREVMKSIRKKINNSELLYSLKQ